MDTVELASKARELRCHIVEELAAAGSGHPGGSLSTAEILTVLYFNEMKLDPANPSWEGRDYFILSKGHAAPALYAVLAMRGFLPIKDLLSLRRIGSPLQGHPCRGKVPGVETSTGSLGQGLAAAAGLAKGLKIQGRDNRVFALVGDGECQEGLVWEAAMFAAHYQLDNLIVFLDHNRLQIDGATEDVMNPEPLDAKFRAFGWQVINIDGHDIEQIKMALLKAKQSQGYPVLILADTVKGRGVSFMENQADWHGKAPNAEQAAAALTELDAKGVC